jgi:hypothetical protein
MKIRGDSPKERLRQRVPGRSGTLYQRTKKKQLQNGQIKEYPLVIGNRDPHNVQHWFWQLTYKEKQPDGKYKSRTVSVAPEQVEVVKVLIAANAQLEAILLFLRGST